MWKLIFHSIQFKCFHLISQVIYVIWQLLIIYLIKTKYSLFKNILFYFMILLKNVQRNSFSIISDENTWHTLSFLSFPFLIFELNCSKFLFPDAASPLISNSFWESNHTLSCSFIWIKKGSLLLGFSVDEASWVSCKLVVEIFFADLEVIFDGETNRSGTKLFNNVSVAERDVFSWKKALQLCWFW